VPIHPATRARLTDIEAAEAALDVSGMISETVARIESEQHIFPPRPRLPRDASLEAPPSAK
jgi:hypothetical protein